MHEIRTPLSVITLNNEMRKRELGNDEYTSEIESALKTLQNSYDDMSFIMTQNKIDYPIEIISLSDIILARIEYFQTIAYSHDKKIQSNIFTQCKIKISKAELIRLIDNNLSNTVKYAERNTIITVTLKDNLLSFHSIGATIENPNEIFKKYVRENNIIGGYGLGLSIVKDIAEKYDITINLSSTGIEGTLFSYRFKCHTNVIQKT